MLAGCDGHTGNDVKNSRWLSSTEKAVYATWYSSSKYSYANNFMAIVEERRRKPNAVPPNSDEFFSDAIIPMRLLEVRMVANQEPQTMSVVYRKVTGKEPRYSMAFESGLPPEVVDSVARKVASSQQDVVDREAELAKAKQAAAALAEPLADLETLRRLVEVAKGSNRAKVKMIVNSESLIKITQKEAEALIREYEVFQLETELDK